MPESSRSPLAERFRNRQLGRKPAQEKKRIKTSVFIDEELMERVNRAWKDYNHDHYPREVIKATFFEELIECGLRHSEEVEELLAND